MPLKVRDVFQFNGKTTDHQFSQDYLIRKSLGYTLYQQVGPREHSKKNNDIGHFLGFKKMLDG